MRVRSASLSIASILVVVLTLAVSPAPAHEEQVRAEGLEQVGFVEIPAVTHLEFMQRTIDGVSRTFALVGSRDANIPTDDEGNHIPGIPQGGLNIVDITDPEAPAFVLNVPCRTDNIDIAVVPVGHEIDGIAYDTMIVLASNDGVGCLWNGARTGGLMFVGLRATPADGEAITADFLGSPIVGTDGKPFTRWKSPAAHTVVAHPTRAVVYSGNQAISIQSPTVEITSLERWPPVLTQHVILPRPGNAVGPHDITFSPAGDRAYVSSIDVSMIWDTSGDKLFAPEILSVLQSPNLKIHHEANLHPNGRHLLVVDESVATSGENVGQCPGGGVHIFDLGPNREFERAPVPVGQFYANDLSTPGVEPGPSARFDISCTAHEFNMPASGRWTPIGWFGAGARLLDLSMLADAPPVPAPVAVTEIGYHVPLGNDTWAAKVHPADERYLVTSDTAYGLRILKITAELP